MKDFKKILVVNVNWVGDVIFSTPIFRALKKRFPRAHVACMAVPRVQEILESCPFVDEIILFDERSTHRTLWAQWQFVQQLRRKHFDIAFLLHRSWTRAFIVFLSRVPQRVGYDTKKRGWFLTHKTDVLLPPVHRSDYYLQVVETYGIPIEDRSCVLEVAEQEQHQVQRLLETEGIHAGDFLAVVNAGGNWDLKRWPKEFFSLLVKRLVDEHGVKVVIPGAAKDVTLAHDIIRDAGVPAVLWAGKTSLKQLMALMKRADVVISSDTGPLHIASCVGKNVIGIFGSTMPEITGPRGKARSIILRKEIACNSQPCYNLSCPDNQCMRAVSVDDVLDAVKTLMAASK